MNNKHMKKKATGFITVLFFIINITFSQEVISSGGDFYNNINGSVSFTIGEPVIETLSGASNILTQGFNQTKLTINEIVIQPVSDYEITVFPNPSVYSFTIKKNNSTELSYQLFDEGGKLVKSDILTGSETIIAMENLSSSIYFLRISNSASEIKTFKIEKQ